MNESGNSGIVSRVAVNQLLTASGLYSRRQLRRTRERLRDMHGAEFAARDKVEIGVEPRRFHFDGLLLEAMLCPPGLVVLHKPTDVVVSRSEPQSLDASVYELLADHPDVDSLEAVGRLDSDSEGLLLFTEDGTLQHRLQHPKFALEREYLCVVQRAPDAKRIEALRRGELTLRDGHTPRPSALHRVEAATLSVPVELDSSSAELWSMTLREGKYHEVRRAMAACGAHVSRLLRTRYGPCELAHHGLDREPGLWRALDAQEMQVIYQAVGLPMPSPVLKVDAWEDESLSET